LTREKWARYRYSSTPPLTKMAFPNQISTAEDLVRAFSAGNHMVLLFAQMQSGKTGTFLETARQLLSSGSIRKTIFMCGSPAVDLHEQLVNDVKTQGLFENNVFKLHDMRERVAAPKKKTLIVWDEAHYGSKRGNIIPDWFRRKGLDTVEKMREKQVYLLMVSATPFDLAFAPQATVKMVPPSEYRGVEHYLENIRENNNENFIQVLNDEYEPHKYGLVRVSKALTEDTVIKSVLNFNSTHSSEWKIITYYPEGGKLRNFSNIVRVLSRRPKNPTLILIKGRCRMGNVLPKQNLKFVYETTDVPNTTSILQSLLGRVCGYHRENISVYLPSIMVTMGKTIPRSMRSDAEMIKKTEIDVYLWAFRKEELPERVRKSKMYIL